MKKVFVLALLMVTGWALAYEQELPADTPLCNIPISARLVAKEALDQSYWSGVNPDGNTDKWNRRYEGSRAEFGSVYGHDYFAVFKSDSFRIDPFRCQKAPNENGNMSIYLKFVRGDGRSLRFWDLYEVGKEAPKNWVVGDILKLANYKFTFLYDDPKYDPYSGLDASVAVDIVMAKITAALKAEQYADALPHFTYLERKNIPLPESFYYHQIHALEKSGNPGEAKQRALEYLRRYGSKGKYYTQVIEIMARQ